MVRIIKRGRRIPAIDVEIDGQGFYQLTGNTPAGRQFMRAVQGYADGVAYCDDARLAQAIADGARQHGLVVTVNGKAYTGG